MTSRAAAPPPPSRTLVAGMGNVLEEDDGFGVRVLEALAREELPEGVRLTEVGTGGIHLVQDLMDGYDALILVDAVDREGEPGTVYTLRPEVPDLDDFDEDERGHFLADTHYTVPAKVLVMARALGFLPERLYIVGCQPGRTELGLDLTERVDEAVRRGVGEVRRLLETD